MKLTIAGGTPIDLLEGKVLIVGGCIVGYKFWQEEGGIKSHQQLEVAYQLSPGETMRRTPEGDYIVGF